MSQPFPSTLEVFSDGLTKSQVDIIDLVSEGKGIQDPTAVKRATCINSLNSLKSSITSFLSGFTLGVGGITGTSVILNNLTYNRISDLSTNISSLISVINNSYVPHSQRLSGVTDEPSGSTLPDFSSLIGLATAYNLTKASISKAKNEPVVDNFSFVFNSIVGDAQDQFDLITRESSNAFQQLESKGSAFYTSYDNLLDSSKVKFASITGPSTSFAASDMANYNTVVTFLNRISKGSVIAGLAGQENNHTRYLVDNFVGGPELKQFLRKADEESNQRVLF